MPSIALRACLASTLPAAFLAAPALAAPALAAPAAPADPPAQAWEASPLVAERWSFYTPMAGLGLSVLGITGLPTPLLGLPLFLSGSAAGHVYAGDPGRGALVALGGAVAPAAAFGAIWGIGNLLIPPVTCSASFGECHAAPPIAPLTGAAVGLGVSIAYTLWAAKDAAATAERRNAERGAEVRP